MASATPYLRLPSQMQSVAAHWPVPNHTAWWQEYIGVNNLPGVVTELRYDRELNPRPPDCKSDVQTVELHHAKLTVTCFLLYSFSALSYPSSSLPNAMLTSVVHQIWTLQSATWAAKSNSHCSLGLSSYADTASVNSCWIVLRIESSTRFNQTSTCVHDSDGNRLDLTVIKYQLTGNSSWMTSKVTQGHRKWRHSIGYIWSLRTSGLYTTSLCCTISQI